MENNPHAPPRESRYDVAIVGGGLGGLTLAIRLAQAGRAVVLIEKKTYPFHKVCGEYISNETLGYLARLGLDLPALAPANITRLQVTAPSGAVLEAPLPLGGFGISRYTLDFALYQLALKAGADVLLGQRATDLGYDPDGSGWVQLEDGQRIQASLLVGAWGKRERLDRALNRPFLGQRTGYMAVKYHVQLPAFPRDLIALHNFQGGYCGVSAIEADAYCLCYLVERQAVKDAGGIVPFEQHVMRQNAFLAALLSGARHLYAQPEVINEISFAPKRAVEKGIWMLGDAAGLIPPLCGNGMAMAIHAGKMLADVLEETHFAKGRIIPAAETRAACESLYSARWRRIFSTRLWVGRQLQQLLGKPRLASPAIRLLSAVPGFTQRLIMATHGRPF